VGVWVVFSKPKGFYRDCRLMSNDAASAFLSNPFQWYYAVKPPLPPACWINSPTIAMSQGAQRRQPLDTIPVITHPVLPLDLYREIFAHSSEAIAIISTEGKYLKQNSAHANLLGYADDELTGQTPAIHMSEENFAAIARELAEKGEYRGEVVSETKTGQTLYIELSAFSMKDSSGNPLCYVGIKRDITERKRAQEALQRNEAELTDFFENASVGLDWVDSDGIITRVNQAELDLLGYSRDEYVGHHISEFYVDRGISQKVLQKLRAGEVLRDYEVTLRCKDRSEKYVRINSSVYRENGRFIHSRSFTHDITDSKRTEQRLEVQYAITRILSESGDLSSSAHQILQTVCQNLKWQLGALWRIDPLSDELRCVSVWRELATPDKGFVDFCRHFSFKKGEGIPGRIWATGEPTWIPDVLADENLPRNAAAQKEGLRGAFGFPIVNGREVLGIVEFFSPEIRQPDPETLAMVGSIGRQIGQFTKRKRVEEERLALLDSERAARSDAEQANRLKDEFLATLSHELRTPLNAVIGWSRMLNSGRLDPESANHALQVIERNAWAQKQIIEDILDVSRVITGKLRLKVGPVDLVPVVEGALDAVRPAMEAKDIHVETVIDAGLKMIMGDGDRLQQVVWNLLSNAAKFTPHGGKVVIRVTQVDAHVQIQVSDSGPGINSTFLPHVFERFRQGDGSTTRTHGGLGLGLAIVRHLVELHGGVITAENRTVGSGATFTVRLPIPSNELRPEALANAANVYKEPEVEPANLENLKILVVDDESDALDLISMELTQHGAQVKSVNSAKAALAELEQDHFDLLISDIGMPETDGYELIRSVRKLQADKRRRIPAVALTAYARVQDRMRAILAGYDTHVPKPVEAHELVTIVASLAGRLGKT
jgi:PAS domain S-box-containing protein